MKVTRLIREYVERSVTAFSQKSQEEIDYGIYQDNIALADEYIEQQTAEFVERLKADVLQRFNLPECAIAYSSERVVVLARHGNDVERKALAAKALRDQRVRDKIDEILLSLELGATKAELDEMIAQLQKESVEN